MRAATIHPAHVSAVTGIVRGLLRGAVYPGVVARAIGDYLISGSRRSLAARVAWLQRTAILHARWYGMALRFTGTIPRGGLIVSNHISYLDIIALSAIVQC